MDELTAFVRARLDEDEASANWPCLTMTSLASIWSDHPDYRAEWAV